MLNKSTDDSYSEAQLKKATTLVRTAQAHAAIIRLLLKEQIEEAACIEESKLSERFEYLMTIGGVGTAFMEIGDTLPENDRTGMPYAIQRALNDWNSEAYDGLADLLKYCHNLIFNSNVEPPDAIGAWIWVNLEKHQAASERLRDVASSLSLVRPTGRMVATTFHNWWKPTVGFNEEL